MALPKILMLHGYTQSAAIFRSKTAAIRKQCKEFEFVYGSHFNITLYQVDAPIQMSMPTETADDREGFDSVAANDEPELAPRAWWTANERADGTKEYRGCEESLKFLIDTLQHDTYVGILGFSQGAAMVGLLSAWIARPHLHPLFAEAQLRPFEFAVCVAGFASVDPAHQSAWAEPVPGRVLHVLGRGDGIVAEDRTLPFIKKFGPESRVEWHDGGHHVPSKAAWRKFFQSYFNHRGDPSVAPPSGSQSPSSRL